MTTATSTELMSISKLVEEFCQESDQDPLAESLFRITLALDHIKHILEKLVQEKEIESRDQHGYVSRYTSSVKSQLEKDLYKAVNSAKDVKKTMKLFNYWVESAAHHSKKMESLQDNMKKNPGQENDNLESEMILLSNFTRLILQDKKMLMNWKRK